MLKKVESKRMRSVNEKYNTLYGMDADSILKDYEEIHINAENRMNPVDDEFKSELDKVMKTINEKKGNRNKTRRSSSIDIKKEIRGFNKIMEEEIARHEELLRMYQR